MPMKSRSLDTPAQNYKYALAADAGGKIGVYESVLFLKNGGPTRT